jgi:hypothetical protein
MIEVSRRGGRPRKVVETTTTTKEIDPEVQETSPALIQEPEELDELEAFLSQFPSEGSVTAWRFRPNQPGEKDYCGRLGSNEASLEWLQTNYGGGRYLLMYHDPQKKIRGQRRFNIADPLKAVPLVALPALPPPVPGGLDPMVHLQLETMREDMKTNRELMLRMVDNLGARQSEGGGGGGLTELVTALAGLRDLTKPSDGQISGMISLFEKGLSLGATGGVQPKSEGIMGIVRELAPVVGEALRTAMSARGGDLPLAGPAGNPAGASGRVVALVPRQESADSQQQADRVNLRNGLNWLKKRCLAGMHVESALDLLMFSIDDPDWQFLFDFVPIPYEEWGKIDADLLKPQFRPWFEALLNELKAQVGARMADATGQEVQEVQNATADLSTSGPAVDGGDSVRDGNVGPTRGNFGARPLPGA